MFGAQGSAVREAAGIEQHAAVRLDADPFARSFDLYADDPVTFDHQLSHRRVEPYLDAFAEAELQQAALQCMSHAHEIAAETIQKRQQADLHEGLFAGPGFAVQVDLRDVRDAYGRARGMAPKVMLPLPERIQVEQCCLE
jgi:hypothetical protein